MTIVGKPKEDIVKTALVVRDNFEKVVPTYFIQREIVNKINEYRASMASIEKNRFNLELGLKTNKATLV